MSSRLDTTAQTSARTGLPLVVGLDGAVLRTNLLLESVLALARRRPSSLLGIPGWLLRGRAVLDAEIATRAPLDPMVLPYNEVVLERIRFERASGRAIVLATRACGAMAGPIARHLGVFDEVLSSDVSTKLAGEAELAALRTRFPEGFEYVDIPSRRAGFGAVAGALRLHHWAKNLLVFLPVLLAHELSDASALGRSALAFLAFGLVASSAYVLNDLLDLDADRRHARKRERPFASGRLALATGLALAPGLLAAGALCAAGLPLGFGLLLGGYFVATLAYSFGLKEAVAVDVIVLASLYAARVFAGGLATGIRVSIWLASFAGFLFLSLALMKRTSELIAAREGPLPGRAYAPGDLDATLSMGTASGYVSVLVLALYISSRDVSRLYMHPGRLWLACPLFLYWLTRAWLLARRGQLQDDPLIFAIGDRVSWIVGALAVGIVMSAV